MIATAQLRALGTGITVAVSEADDLARAVAVVEQELACIDLACSRFRSDSELSRLNNHPGQWIRISPLLMTALEVALRAAALTDGLVDPTIGKALIEAGYDRDFDQLEKDGPALPAITLAPQPYQLVRLDPETNRAWIPRDVCLDLGSTAKALAADQAAAALAALTGGGAMVSCGGDLATAGPAPDGGWVVQVAAHHADEPNEEKETLTLTEGGLATSGTVHRRWRRGDRELHHIIDPRTGQPAETPWRLATVAAQTCVDANIASTAAIVMGEGAEAWLEERGLAARLVRTDGSVVRVAGWPAWP